MERERASRRVETTSWWSLIKRTWCVFIMRGHKWPLLGKRQNLVCQRCGIIAYTKKPYRKGKREGRR